MTGSGVTPLPPRLTLAGGLSPVNSPCSPWTLPRSRTSAMTSGSNAQHVARWPAGEEYLRPSLTPTSPGPPRARPATARPHRLSLKSHHLLSRARQQPVHPGRPSVQVRHPHATQVCYSSCDRTSHRFMCGRSGMAASSWPAPDQDPGGDPGLRTPLLARRGPGADTADGLPVADLANRASSRERRAAPPPAPGRRHQAGRRRAGQPAARVGAASHGRSPGGRGRLAAEDRPVQAVAAVEGLQDRQPDGVPVAGERLLVTSAPPATRARLRGGALASPSAAVLCPCGSLSPHSSGCSSPSGRVHRCLSRSFVGAAVRALLPTSDRAAPLAA